MRTGLEAFEARDKSSGRQFKSAGAFVNKIVTMPHVFAKLVICYASKAHKYGVYLVLVLVYKLY